MRDCAWSCKAVEKKEEEEKEKKKKSGAAAIVFFAAFLDTKKEVRVKRSYRSAGAKPHCYCI